MDEIARYIKELSSQQVEASKPVAIFFGEIIAVNPLKIQLDQKLILTETFLVLTKNVVDYSINITVEHTTESHTHSHSYIDDSTTRTTNPHTHNHAYVGTKKFTIHNKLKEGDTAILLRVQGGQKFVVIDKVGGGFV